MNLPKPFQDALFILNRIEAAGHQAYFVGGCVRDVFLDRPIGDIDITTSAKPQKIQEIFDEVIPVGIEHGTVIVRHNQVSYEVTTFRVEGTYSDQRHPDSVQFIDYIDKDLERRDFTINALAMDSNGNVLDLFHGLEDLDNRIIRTVGNGYERFKEDSLRILRAIRFSSQLGFTIEEGTKTAMKAVKKEVEGLAVERITKEMQKLFSGDFVASGLHNLLEIGLEEHLPVFNRYQVLHALIPKIKPLPSLSEVICLLHQTNKEIIIHEIVKGWKCSNKIYREATQLNEAINYYERNGLDNWLVYILLPNLHNEFSRLTQILFMDVVEKDELQRIKAQLPIRSKQELLMNGNDIIGMFPNLHKGPWINGLITQIEKQIVLGKLENNKSMLKDWLKWNPPEEN